MTLFFALFMIGSGAFAPTHAIENRQATILEGRALSLTHQALLAVKKDQWDRGERLIAQADNPLATKLYQWLYFTHRDSAVVRFDSLATFMRTNPEWPLQGRMRRVAERAMPPGLSDEAVIVWFRQFPPRSAAAMIRYLDALEDAAGQTARIEAILAPWWEDALLTPDEQSYFLKHYAAYMTRAMHQKRFDQMLFHDHYTNARVLARIMGGGYPALAEARIGLAEDKSNLDRLIAAVPGDLKNDPGLQYERLHWRRVHDYDYRAIEILHRPPSAERIGNLAAWWRERHIIARRLIESKQYNSVYLLVSKHQQKDGLGFAQAEFLSGWLALRFLDEPWRAFEHFERLYNNTKTPISRARGAYWAGRASEALGHKEIAQQWYRAAARHQTAFYGQVALAALDEEYVPPQQLPPAGTPGGKLAFEHQEMVQAARLLSNAGLRRETTDFLNALAEAAQTPEEYLYVADLARELKHYHNGIRLAKEGLQKNIFLMDHAYPTMLSRMHNVDTEWALVHALIRQESAFDYEAVSPAGARGLMQLMPATARDIAQKKGLRHSTDWLTRNPDYNIRLGSYYIQQMLDYYDGSYPLAVAAYNGGPGRVDRWLKEIGDPRKGEIEMPDWIESIPVYETRNYVQRVLEGVYVYRLKLRHIQDNGDAPIHVALH